MTILLNRWLRAHLHGNDTNKNVYPDARTAGARDIEEFGDVETIGPIRRERKNEFTYKRLFLYTANS